MNQSYLAASFTIAMAFTRSPAAYLALPVMFFLFLSFSSFQDSFDDIEV